MPSTPCFSLIVAVAKNGVIGRDGELPWRLSADLQRFKRITMGHPLMMGRKTWESLGRPLPGRTSIVVTRQADYATGFDEVLIAGSLEEALEQASKAPGGSEEIFLIGGGQLFEAGLPRTNRLYYTLVDAEVEGDALFPAIDWQQWRRLEETHYPADERNDHAHLFTVCERIL